MTACASRARGLERAHARRWNCRALGPFAAGALGSTSRGSPGSPTCWVWRSRDSPDARARRRRALLGRLGRCHRGGARCGGLLTGVAARSRRRPATLRRPRTVRPRRLASRAAFDRTRRGLPRGALPLRLA